MIDITTKPMIVDAHVKVAVNTVLPFYMGAELIRASSSESTTPDICVNMAPKICEVYSNVLIIWYKRSAD